MRARHAAERSFQWTRPMLLFPVWAELLFRFLSAHLSEWLVSSDRWLLMALLGFEYYPREPFKLHIECQRHPELTSPHYLSHLSMFAVGFFSAFLMPFVIEDITKSSHRDVISKAILFH